MDRRQQKKATFSGGILLPSQLLSINQAIRLSPLFGPSYAIRGEVYLQNRRWQSALNDYRKILLLKRDDKNARETYDKIIQQINKAGPGSLLSP